MNYITETYSLKYYGECMNYRKQRSRVEIWRKGAVGPTYPREIGDITGLSLAINGNVEIDAPVVKTILNLSMADTWDEPQEEAAGAKKHGAWEEFYTPDSTAYLIRLYTREEGDDGWELRWSGYVTPDNWRESISYRGEVTVTARDNLGHLKDFEFDLPGDESGLVSVSDIIDGALRKIAFPMDVTVGIGASGARAALLSGGDTLSDAMVAVSELKDMDWGEALESVLDSLGLTIRYTDRNNVVVTHIRNLPLCGGTQAPATQVIEFYGPGTRLLVPAYRDVVIDTDFGYVRDVPFGSGVTGEYGASESFRYGYYDERRQTQFRGTALRCQVSGTGTGWSSVGKAFVDPSKYFSSGNRGSRGGATVDTRTTALLMANATDDDVRKTEASFAFGRVNTPAAKISIEVTAAFNLAGQYLIPAGGLRSLEWSARYDVPESGTTYWWNGSQWKNTQVWTLSEDGSMDLSAPMNISEIPGWGLLTVIVRDIKASAGFCVGVSSLVLSCVPAASSLKGDEVTVVNNPEYNVRAKRSPRFGFLSRPVDWNVIGNYPDAFWRYGSGLRISPYPYQQTWSDGTEALGFPAQWAKQTLMFHHVALQQIEGVAGVTGGGMWRFDRLTGYKGHTFLQQGGTLDLLTGHVSGLSLREFIPYETLWEGAPSVSPSSAALPRNGGQASFLVTAPAGRSWTVDYLPDWLTAYPAAGAGDSTVTVTAEPNDGGARSAVIYIAGAPVTVTQARADLSLTATPTEITFPVGETTRLLEIQASSGEGWQLVSDSPWALVNGGASLTGTGSDMAVEVTALENGTGSSRLATLSLYDGNGDLAQTVTVTQTVDAAILRLTISSNVDDPVIELAFGGYPVAYTPGMEVPPGEQVSVTVSKDGYQPISDSFVMSGATTDMFYPLMRDVEVSFSYPDVVSPPAQNVPITVSDPSGKGWGISFGEPYRLGFITGAGVTSGDATVSGTGITGTGDAVVYLTVPANDEAASITIGNNSNPIFIRTTAAGSWERGIIFSHLGTSSQIVPVSAVALNKGSLSLGAGESETLTATVSPSNATDKSLSWTSSNPLVASVSQSGEVTAIGAGTATIRASATDGSNKYATCTVTVSSSTIPVTGVTLDKNAVNVGVGGTTALTATVSPSNATDRSVIWTSSDTTVASVSNSGVVTGVATGTATITVRTTDGGHMATCRVAVTASGSLSIQDVTAGSQQTSAAADVVCQNVNTASITVSENASWIAGAVVDLSGTVPRVRLTLYSNQADTQRTAIVTVTAMDINGDEVTADFRVTQRANTSSDVPCTGVSVSGPAAIANSGNEATYNAVLSPSNTTQRGVSWSVSGAGAAYVELVSDGLQCLVRVLEGASGQTVTLKAANSYNGNIYGTKDVTVTHIYDSGNISVDPSSVTVADIATSDNTPVVTTEGLVPGSLVVRSVSGFVTSASVQEGRLVTVFPANTGTESRTGTVVLDATDLNGDPVSYTVSYLQTGVIPPDWGFGITGLQRVREGGKARYYWSVLWVNRGNTQAIAYAPGWTLRVIRNGQVALTYGGTLDDKVIAGGGSEEEIYSYAVNASKVEGETYELTMWSGTVTREYEGDGDDPVVE